MVRKFLALGAVSFITGMVTTMGGCSSESSGGGDLDAGPTDAAPERRPRPDTGPEEDDSGACPVDPEVTMKDYDDQVGWKPTKGDPGACSADDLALMEKNSDDQSLKSFFDFGKGVSERCVKCAISKDTDDSWAPIVGIEKNAGEKGYYNFGACYAALEGPACGKAIQYAEFCLKASCNECAPSSGSTRTKCIRAALETTCKEFSDAVAKSCPKLEDTQDACGRDIFDAIEAICGATPGDAGTEAGTDAGSDASSDAEADADAN